jgi:Flp pilus assembly protein TadG
MRLRPWHLLRTVAREEAGASAVEFALVCIPFLALVLAALQTSIVFFMGEALQSATQISVRALLTGQVAGNGMTQAAFKTWVCGNLPSPLQGSDGKCSNLMIDVESANSFSTLNTAAITPTYNSSGAPTYTGNFNIGSPGSAVIVRTMYNWPVFNLPLGFSLQDQTNGTYLLVGTAVFENEPYPSTTAS